MPPAFYLPVRRHLNRSKKRKRRRDKVCERRIEEEEVLDGEEREENDPSFWLKSCAQSYGCAVQPLGNLFLSTTSSYNCRNPGLGTLHCLPDGLLIDQILSHLTSVDLGRLATVSKAFYVFSNHEPLWRSVVLDRLGGSFLFKGSWKSTFVLASSPEFNPSATRNGGVVVRDFYSDYLFQSWLCANLEMKPEWLARDNIQRRHKIAVEEFVRDFEEPNKPVLLEGCLDNWAALTKWNRENLIQVCKDVTFSVGPVEMKLPDYFHYADLVKEERPLYLFDPKFAEKVPSLGSDYEVPIYFQEDLFSLMGKERPDYKWIIFGPAGSGSSFHVDPNSTSAWNAVIKGSKKWILFPPDVIPPGVHPSPDGAEVACPVSIMEWFMNFYGATKKWKRRPIECVCKAGEVVFVPNGWWHLVINLEDSIAITQNYVSR